MNAKERVKTAMRGETPDRVPVFCQLSLGHYALHTEVSSFDMWYDSCAFANALLTLAERYNFDGILVNLPGRPPNWRKHIEKTERQQDTTVIYWDNGQKSVCPDNDNTHNITAEAERPTFEKVDPAMLYYIEPHDITGSNYPFTYGFSSLPGLHNENFFPEYSLDPLKKVIEKSSGRFHVSGEVHAPFSQLMELFGYSNALIMLLEQPAKCERMLENLARGTAEWAVKQASAGADAILVSSPFAGGGFISREHYKQFVLPYEKYVVEEFHYRTGLPIYVHTCGAIGDRIDLMIEASYDGIDTMDPPPLGNADIATIKKKFGDRVFIKGNVDPVNVLLKGSPNDIYAKAVELICSAGKGGGYILSTACSVAPSATEENIAMLYKASVENPY